MEFKKGINYIMDHPMIGKIVIGKATPGWHFGLNIYPDLELLDLEDWSKALQEDDVKIYTDEEGSPEVSYEDLYKIITKRKCLETKEYMDLLKEATGAYFEKGKRGLLAHKSFIINFKKQNPTLYANWAPLIVTWIRTDGTYDLIPTKYEPEEDTTDKKEVN